MWRFTATTRSTQRAQTSAERQHNRIAEWFLQCKLAMQLWSESTRYFFDNPVNPDFGLRTPGSGRLSGSSPKFTPLVPGPSPTPPRNVVKIRSNFFRYPTDRKTERSENITSFGGGNDNSRRNSRNHSTITIAGQLLSCMVCSNKISGVFL